MSHWSSSGIHNESYAIDRAHHPFQPSFKNSAGVSEKLKRLPLYITVTLLYLEMIIPRSRSRSFESITRTHNRVLDFFKNQNVSSNMIHATMMAKFRIWFVVNETFLQMSTGLVKLTKSKVAIWNKSYLV